MAGRRDLMLRDLTNSPEFVEELLPAAERTALLYHLSYLSLANFPKAERLLRERALETQLLFGDSEVLLLKCATTSDDLVSSLLPMLRLSVEKNQNILIQKYLEKARTWINDIVERVREIIESFKKHNKDVSRCTSDVITEKSEIEKEKAEKSDEIKSLELMVARFQDMLRINQEEIGQTEARIQEKNSELHDHVSEVCRKSKSMSILASMVPFIGPIIKSIYETATSPGETARTEALTNDLSRLSSEKSDLRKKEWDIQVKMMDLQLKLSILNIQEGTIPDPVHLKNVQKCLSQIVQILIQLHKFWLSVGELLDSLRNKTFVGEDIFKVNMDDTTNDFLKSIETAEEYWKKFGHGCMRATELFSSECKDAYKFLESTPVVGSDEWHQEYKSVMKKLEKISQDPIRQSNKVTITELDA